MILNHCSKAMYPFYKEMIEEKLHLRCYGYLPRLPEAEIGSRHLGLVTAEEIENLKEKMEVLGKVAAETLDLEGILALAQSAAEIECEEICIPQVLEKPVSIGVARDKAFCFYYEDNFTLLKKMGAELIPFSPLMDKELPDGISGVILGGGYPEEYLCELSSNESMLESVRSAAAGGMPVYAECGGFMCDDEKSGSLWI